MIFVKKGNNDDVFLFSKPQDIQQNLFLKAMKEMESQTKRKDSGNFNPFKDLQIQSPLELKEFTFNSKHLIKKGKIKKEEN